MSECDHRIICRAYDSRGWHCQNCNKNFEVAEKQPREFWILKDTWKTLYGGHILVFETKDMAESMSAGYGGEIIHVVEQP